MYPVTHMTIAVGSVWLGGRLWRCLRGGAVVDAIDYRFAAFGALVPDLIDKPLAVDGDSPSWVSIVSIPAAVLATGLALLRVFRAARRLGSRTDSVEEQSKLARGIFRSHLVCLAGMSVVLAVQLVGA